MNDAVGIFFALSALVGFIFFSVMGATLFVFILGLLGVTIDYFVNRLGLKPLSRPTVLFQTSEQGNRRSNKADYAVQIKDYVQYFKSRCRHFNFMKGEAITYHGSNSQFANDTKKYASNLPNSHFQDVVNPPVENIPQHSNTKVSQANGACQPKGNDTLRWLIKIKGFHTI